MESTEEMGHPWWNYNWNQELLPWMEWASTEDIVTVNLIIIYGHFIILTMSFLLVLYYYPVCIIITFLFHWKRLPQSSFWIPDFVQIIGQWGSPAVGKWNSCRETILSLPYKTHVLSSPLIPFKLMVRPWSPAPTPFYPSSCTSFTSNFAQVGVFVKFPTEFYLFPFLQF